MTIESCLSIRYKPDSKNTNGTVQMVQYKLKSSNEFITSVNRWAYIAKKGVPQSQPCTSVCSRRQFTAKQRTK